MSPSKKIITLVTILVSFFLFSCGVSSTELEVGGEDGWVVPNSNKTHGDMFNEWASHNRFKVGDTIRKHFLFPSLSLRLSSSLHIC